MGSPKVPVERAIWKGVVLRSYPMTADRRGLRVNETEAKAADREWSDRANRPEFKVTGDQYEVGWSRREVQYALTMLGLDAPYSRSVDKRYALLCYFAQRDQLAPVGRAA